MKTKNNPKIKLFVFFFVLTLLSPLSLFSQEKPKLNAQALLDMKMDAAFASIEGLTKEETKEIVSQMRAIYRDSNPNIDKFYFLISHLEEIQAIEKEQSRLESLNLVYALGFLLFMGLLIYIWWNQRKIQIQLSRISK